MVTADKFLQLVNSPFKFRLFLFYKLPSAFFCGVRVRHADENKCVVTVPYKWLSQNPFKSTYFACLSMAAEMSTGILAMTHLHQRKPAVSMLVLDVKGNFFKKAVGRTTFTCEDGPFIKNSIEEAVSSGEGRSVTAKSTGRNANNEIVAEFEITWSFKVRSK
jgi:hypothetical protein